MDTSSLKSSRFSGPILLSDSGREKDGGNTSGQEQDRSSRAAFDLAEQNGLVVVRPLPNQIQIDIDTDADYRVYAQNYGVVNRIRPIQAQVIAPSRNKIEGRHITLTFSDNLTPIERIAFQAVLGSDRSREALSLERVYNGDPTPTLFLEKKA